MINADFHFGTLAYYVYSLVYLCCSLFQQEIKKTGLKLFRMPIGRLEPKTL